MILNDSQNQLSKNDQANFKQLIKFYDGKQYKKGLKLAEKILENSPNHAETISLKGLFNTLTDKQEEGVKICKAGLMKNLKSSLCWHILGIVQRNDKNYIEATKSYSQAFKLDQTNTQIQRDLCLLQIQIRDLVGHHESRLKCLQQNPKLNTNWASFAVANHLIQEYEEARKVLASFHTILKENDDQKPSEKNELYLYEAQIILESKKYKDLLIFLKENQKKILDKLCFYEYKLEALQNLNSYVQQLPVLEKLLQICPENHKFIHQYIKLLDPENLKYKNQEEVRVDYKQQDLENLRKDFEKKLTLKEYPKSVFEDLKTKFPNSQSIKLIELQYYQGEQFDQTFFNYIKPYYVNSKPSLFNEIKNLYQDSQKQKQIEKIFIQQNQSLIKNNQFQGESDIQNECAQLWSYLLLAQHYDYLKQYDQALKNIDEAIKHTPTLIELYLVKAKIFKHQQQFEQAFAQADKARQMDLADRYLNNKAIKYTLLCNDTQKAQELITLFMKHDEEQNVYELQTNWFELAMANAFLRKKDYGSALKHFKFIEKQFDDIQEDQFDFHVYCIRKYTLRQYIELIRYEDNLSGNKLFLKGFTQFMNALLEYNSTDKQVQKVEYDESNQIQKTNKLLDLHGEKYLQDMKSPIKEAVNIAKKYDNIEIKQQDQAKITYKTIFNVYLADKNYEMCSKYVQRLLKLGEGQDCKQELTKKVQEMENGKVKDKILQILKDLN